MPHPREFDHYFWPRDRESDEKIARVAGIRSLKKISRGLPGGEEMYPVGTDRDIRNKLHLYPDLDYRPWPHHDITGQWQCLLTGIRIFIWIFLNYQKFTKETRLRDLTFYKFSYNSKSDV